MAETLAREKCTSADHAHFKWRKLLAFFSAHFFLNENRKICEPTEKGEKGKIPHLLWKEFE